MRKHAFGAVTALALALSLALTGCGGKGDAERLAGVWDCALEVADFFNEGFEEEQLGDYLHLDTFPLTLRFTFKTDGTYECAVDNDAFAQSMEGVKTIVKDGLAKYAEDLIAAQGVEMTADELFQAVGTSLDEMVDQTFAEEGLDSVADEYNFDGNFTAADGKLCLSDGTDYNVDPGLYFLYTFSGDNTLDLTGSSGYQEGEDLFDGFYPLTLTKVG